MKTLRILITGWVVGGALLVAMGMDRGAAPSTPVERRPLPAAEDPVARSERRSTGTAILLPVQGMTPDQLRDNFTQPRGGGRLHGAIDILAPRGTPVVAAVDGTIRKLFNSRAGGLTVYQFDEKQERVYYYAHLDRYADDIAEGLFVKQGRVIGYVGTTGNAPPDTPHLHFAIETLTPEKVWWKGTPLNPYPLLTTPASTLP